LIEVKVAEMNQLFNTMDPSPFHERDLDREAEQFILSWAREHPSQAALKLVVHVGQAPAGGGDAQKALAESVRHYFEYRADMTRREFRQLMREGRWSLLVGVLFLAVCELGAQALPVSPNPWLATLRMGLTIIGWVAMWRPLEIYLYRWWPVRELERIYRKLSAMAVDVRVAPGGSGAQSGTGLPPV
jgi:hypothetical protein